MSKRSPRPVNGILLLYNYDRATSAQTLVEHVGALKRHSRFRVWEVNTSVGYPKSLDELDFQTIVLHYSIFNPTSYRLDGGFLELLERSASSYKIAFFQDEQHYCQQRFAFLNRYDFDCVYTLVEPRYFDQFYRRNTRVRRLVNYIPGHVSDELIESAARLTRPDHEREIDIGYRASRIAYYMGRGAIEKYEIAVRFEERARDLGLKLDISTDYARRIHGKDWYNFVANCRAMLGAEAGASITDINDTIRPEYERLIALFPEMTFEEMSERLLAKHEGQIPQRVISPRHFEAAAFRTTQILYEGRFSGIMQPGLHYISLHKDFSNFDEVIRLFRDPHLRREITERAYQDLIASGRYSYQNLIAEFDAGLIEEGLQPEMAQADAERVTKMLARDHLQLRLRARKNALLYSNFPGRDVLALFARPPLSVYRKLRRMGQH